MQYYKSEMSRSPLEPLLDKVEAADKDPNAANDAVPTVEQFLDEEGKYQIMCS